MILCSRRACRRHRNASVAGEFAPERIAHSPDPVRPPPQRLKSRTGPSGENKVLGHLIAAARHNTAGVDAMFDRAPRDQPAGNHDFGGAQHVIVKRFELRMMPQPSGIASCHAHDVRNARHLGGEMSGHPIGLHIMGIDHVERPLAMKRRGMAASFETNGLAIGR